MGFERWVYAARLRMRSLLSRNDVEKELAEEMEFHIEQRIAEGKARGLTAEQARHEALRAMQGVEQSKENCRDTRRVRPIENLARDLRYAARMLRKSPAFTAVAVLSLALGIGANTAIFGLIDALLVRPLPVPKPQELRTIYARANDPNPRPYLTFPIFEALRARNHVFSHVFTWSDHQFQMRSGADMVHVDGLLASGDYFEALGVPASLGRTFRDADDHPIGGPDGPVAVIGDRFWSSQFHRNPAAIGRSITLDKVNFKIIGVMPPSFFGAEVATHPDIWVPLSFASRIEDPFCISSRSCWWLILMGRVKPGISERQVQANLNVVSPRILQDTVPAWSKAQQRNYLSWKFETSPGAEGWTFLRLMFSNPLAILMTLVGLVLAIACANMANLLLARASARHREIAVRLSLGAGRGRIIRQLLTESALLSTLGGVTGILFAFSLIRLLTAFLEVKQQTLPIKLDLHPDWRVILFTLTVAVGSGLLFGLAPALKATRAAISTTLKESANNLRGREHRAGIGQLILSIQVTLSVLLVAAAGLFAGSLVRLLNVKTGFDAKNVVLIGIDTDRRTDRASLVDLYRRLLDRVTAMPGIQTASLLWFTPLTGGGWDESPTIPGRTDLSEQQRDTYINPIGPHFFEAMGISLLAGRQFDRGDTAKSERVGIISEVAAHRFYPNTDPIGARLVLGNSAIRIVGVARDITYLSLRDPAPPELYIPYAQEDGMPSLTFAFKTPLDPAVVSAEFRKALHDIAPDIPMGATKTMGEQMNEAVGRERLVASLSIFFGVLALLITCIGLHGILAYVVTRRSGEIGIRMALGAQGANVVWLVLRETVGFVFAGLVVGVAAALAVSRLIVSLLYGIRPNDPVTLAVAVVALLLVAAAASYVPARRASRLDPAIALRQE